MKSGGENWYFLTADYTFGTTMEREASDVITANGGKVLGSVRHPLNTTDFSSFLLQAQKLEGADRRPRQRRHRHHKCDQDGGRIRHRCRGQKLVGLVIFINDIHALGLKSSNGLLLTTAFYWDLNDKTRAFAERFAKRNGGKMPSMSQAGSYSGTLAYLAAVARNRPRADDGAAVVSAMRAAGVF